jgi:hypothetical protein
VAKAKKQRIPETGTTTIPIPKSWLKERAAPFDQKEFGRKLDDHISGRYLARQIARAGARQTPATPTGTAKTWVAGEIERMKTAGEIRGVRITELSKQLHKRMSKAAAADKSLRLVGWRHIKNCLPSWGLWPIS